MAFSLNQTRTRATLGVSNRAHSQHTRAHPQAGTRLGDTPRGTTVCLHGARVVSVSGASARSRGNAKGSGWKKEDKQPPRRQARLGEV